MQTARPARTAGERWTRHELEALLAGGLRPRAWVRFLRASFQRSAQVRAARPDLARRERWWAGLGAAVWISLWALRVPPYRTALGRGLAGWATTVVMLDWHLGMLETEDGRPRNLGPADALTLTRAWLVPAVSARPTPALCLLGFATDALDGPLARATEPTRFGRDLEGLVDACFGAAVIRGATRHGGLGRVARTGELVRLCAGVAYSVAVYFGRAEPPSAALVRAGRVVTPLRVVALTAAAGRRRGAADRLLLTSSALSLGLVWAAGARNSAGETRSAA